MNKTRIGLNVAGCLLLPFALVCLFASGISARGDATTSYEDATPRFLLSLAITALICAITEFVSAARTPESLAARDTWVSILMPTGVIGLYFAVAGGAIPGVYRQLNQDSPLHGDVLAGLVCLGAVATVTLTGLALRRFNSVEHRASRQL